MIVVVVKIDQIVECAFASVQHVITLYQKKVTTSTLHRHTNGTRSLARHKRPLDTTLKQATIHKLNRWN